MLIEITDHWMSEERGNKKPPRQAASTGMVGGRHLGVQNRTGSRMTLRLAAGTVP